MAEQKHYEAIKPPKFYTIPSPHTLKLTDVSAIRLGGDWCVICEDILSEVASDFVKRLKLSNTETDKKIVLKLSDAEKEAYSVDFGDELITVEGGSVNAIRYALYTMVDMNRELLFPRGRIEDKPLLNMRGFCINFSALSHATVDEVLMMIKWAAEAKINTLLMEYESRFPFKAYPEARSPFAFTEEEVRLIVTTAEGYGMDVIPLTQTFGHLEHILRSPACTYIREQSDSYAQLCPLHDDAMSFIKGQLDEVIALHPNSKYIHIGGDETRQLGKCPKCAAFVKEHGIGALYSQLMNRVIDYVCSRGLTPMIYDDMLCAHPDAIGDLDRRAIIVYWDYWATAPEVPHLIARYGDSPVYTYDKRWEDGTWTDELEDVTRRVIEVFGEGGVEDVEKSLGKDFMNVYGKYLGENFPKYFKAFPYIEFFMDQGFRVITMPTGMGNTDNYLGMPNQARYTANIRVCCERTAEAGAMGIISSMWYPFPIPMYPIGISTAANYSWGLTDYTASLPDWRKK